MKKRTYHSEARETQAESTRSNILKAAKKLFQKEGFDKVTIQMIAESAEVAAPTIYAAFKSKRGLLQALIDSALPQDQFLALVESSMAEKKPEKKLAATAKLTRKLYDAEKELMDLIRDASVVSAEFRALEQEREQRRYERQAEYVKTLKPIALSQQEARDILWSLTGRDLYRLFVIERKWSSDAYEKWLSEILIKAILG